MVGYPVPSWSWFPSGWSRLWMACSIICLPWIVGDQRIFEHAIQEGFGLVPAILLSQPLVGKPKH